MILNSRNRKRITAAIDLLQLVSDDLQFVLDNLAPRGIPAAAVGTMLRYSRTVDTFERNVAELQSILDHPPSLGAAQSLRAVPDPLSAMDAEPEPGLANAAAGSSSRAAR